ncbi:unnamed protein product [Paramecium sonneborni]|uniref:Uncharacterized protein n=1 Tax=Paramecium sonneborni TaxID=65129 RepID=A0A8S1QZW5_9CILI|nr:unnamed protein product [Paramecium sonneborni]
MNLSFEAVRKIVYQGLNAIDLKQKIDCNYILQIVENYFPQTTKDKLDQLLSFRVSDGFAKIKALFFRTSNPYLVQLRETEPLTKYPLIKVSSFRILGRPVEGDDFPILILEFERLSILDKIIGQPISFKSYVANGYQNPNGALFPNDFDLAEIDDLLFSNQKSQSIHFNQPQNILQQPKLQQNIFQQPLQDIQNKNEDKTKIENKISLSKSKFQQQKQIEMPQTEIIQYKQQKVLAQKLYNDQNMPNQSIFTTYNQEQLKQLQNQKQQQQQRVQIQPQQQHLQSNQQQPNQNNKPKNQTNNKVASQIDVFPLSQINPSFQQPFRGRVVKVNEIKSYTSQKQKDGKLFGIQVIDEENLISMMFFDQAAEKFHDCLIQGKCYIFQGVTVKPAKNVEQLQKIGCLPYDYACDQNAQIIEIDDVMGIPLNTFNFVKLNTINLQKVEVQLDVVAVIKSTSGVKEFQARNKDEKSIRIQLVVYDDSLQEIEITLYGNLAQQYPFKVKEIYMFKNLKINEYQGKKSLKNNYLTSIHFDQNRKEVKALQKWLQNFDGKLSEPISKIKLISELINESNKCEQDQNLKIYSDVRAQLVLIKNTGTLYYQSCTNCLKKVTTDLDCYFCSSCNLTMKEPKYRYILNCKIADSSGNIWVSVGDQQANQIIDVSAHFLKQLFEQGKEKEKNEILNKSSNKEFRFKLISKLEEFNDVKRVKHSVSSIIPISNSDTQDIFNQVEFLMKNIG